MEIIGAKIGDNMKIWIDLTNSPHVQFFAGMIRELERAHEILITCRPLANTIELLDLHGLHYHMVGAHYGKSSFKKAFGFPLRISQLYFFLLGKGVDAAISHSSFYSPIVARLLDVPSIYLNDNEHAEGNRVSFIFANHIMVPEFLATEKIERQWAKAEKVIHYPGVKEGVYLWYYEPKRSGNFKIDKRHDQKVIFIRPEPWTAQYYQGETNFIDELLINLKDDFKIVLLPRGEEQKAYYMQDRFAPIMVPEKSISLADVMENCDLFIGAGGTMTREAAVLGIPTISIYQDKLLDVDNYLIKNHAMIHEKDLTAERVIRFVQDVQRRPSNQDLLQKGEQAYELIKQVLLDENSIDRETNKNA